MAEFVHISAGYLRSLYKNIFDVTPEQDILRARIEKAKSLLSLTDKTIAQISELSGFENENYFCRIFKAEVSFTPTQYRKKFIGPEGIRLFQLI